MDTKSASLITSGMIIGLVILLMVLMLYSIFVAGPRPSQEVEQQPSQAKERLAFARGVLLGQRRILVLYAHTDEERNELRALIKQGVAQARTEYGTEMADEPPGSSVPLPTNSGPPFALKITPNAMIAIEVPYIESRSGGACNIPSIPEPAIDFKALGISRVTT